MPLETGLKKQNSEIVAMTTGSASKKVPLTGNNNM